MSDKDAFDHSNNFEKHLTNAGAPYQISEAATRVFDTLKISTLIAQHYFGEEPSPEYILAINKMVLDTSKTITIDDIKPDITPEI